MGAHSRNKGRRGELEWAKYVGGDRVNDEGLPGPDVESKPLGIFPPLALWDSKRPGKLPKWLSEEWMQKALNDGCDAVAFREDGGKWWVLMPAERLDR
jgi:hypothetical protein